MPVGIYPRTQQQLERLKKVTPFQKGHKIGVGRPCPEEVRKKISYAQMGKAKQTQESIKKIKEARAKQVFTEERNKKISDAHTGSKHWNWQGGKTKITNKIRNSREYKLWRDAVYKRDNYTCVWCGKRGVRLNADHIKPFCDYPELRFAIDNGRTLCIDCHKKTDTYGWIWANKKKGTLY